MKVKFCPCCRGSVKFVTERKCYGHGEYPLIGYIMCNNCHLRSGDEIIDGFYGTKTTVQDVVDKWNNRISSSDVEYIELPDIVVDRYDDVKRFDVYGSIEDIFLRAFAPILSGSDEERTSM